MRYTITLDFYAWADSDEEIKKQANDLVKAMREKEDNQANVLEIHETPFASLSVRKLNIN